MLCAAAVYGCLCSDEADCIFPKTWQKLCLRCAYVKKAMRGEAPSLSRVCCQARQKARHIAESGTA